MVLSMVSVSSIYETSKFSLISLDQISFEIWHFSALEMNILERRLFVFSYIEFLALCIVMSQSSDCEVETSDGGDPRCIVVFVSQVREYIEDPAVRQDSCSGKGEQVIHDLECS